MRTLLAVAPLVALCSGCTYPTKFQIHAADVSSLQDNVEATVYLDEHREITKTGAFVFVKGDLKSQMIYVPSIVVGAEGICFPSSYPITAFWDALRLEEVDPRIATRVILPRRGLRITRADQQSWEIEGASELLQIWLPAHLEAVEDAHRNFIDLPSITYAARTSVGWLPPGDADTLAARANPPGLSKFLPDPARRAAEQRPALSAFLGWRWGDFDRIDYLDTWPGNHLAATEAAIKYRIAENDYAVRSAIFYRTGLVPGPCPLLKGGKPLLARPPK
jgi:hypothetical protein